MSGEDNDLGIEARCVIRRYTDGLAGDNNLERAVKEHPIALPITCMEKRQRKERQFWQNSNEGSRVFDDLAERRELLKDAWKNFQSAETSPVKSTKIEYWSRLRKLDPKDQLKVPFKKLGITDVEDLKATVVECERKWASRDSQLTEKTKNGFHSVCRWLDTHQDIFSCIPTQSEYVSVLYGTVNLLIKASARHVKYTAEMSHAILQVFEEIEDVINLVGIMNTESMRRRMSKLYTQVFVFLHSAMDWFESKTRSKIRDAFNDSLYDTLKERINEIKRLCEDIRAQAQVSHLAESRDHRLTSEQTNDIARDTNYRLRQSINVYGESLRTMSKSNQFLLQENKLLGKEVEEYARKLELLEHEKQVACDMNHHLTDIFQSNWTLSKDTQDHGKLQVIIAASTNEDRTKQVQTIEHTLVTAQSFLRETVLHESEHLEEYIIGQRISKHLYHIPVSVGAPVVSKLQQWSQALSSQVLWILGPPDINLPSNMSFAASSIIATALKLDIPLLSHFCALPSYKPDGYPQPREQIALTGLAYSLIRQLIQQMPPFIDAGIDLSSSRLQKLDGSIDSWDECLELLNDLLNHFPMPILLCVIDGLARLDFREGSPPCAQLLEILIGKCSTPGARFKLLLTTSGTPAGQKAALRDMIPGHQRYYENQQPSKYGRLKGSFPLDVSRQLSNSSVGLDQANGSDGSTQVDT